MTVLVLACGATMYQQPFCGLKWRWSAKLFVISFLIILLCILWQAKDGCAELTQNSRFITEYRPGPLDSSDSLLVVTLLGGSVVAIRSDSGEVLWEYDTGNPLVRVRQGKAMPPGLHMLSGVDGGLYLYSTALAAAAAAPEGSAAAGPTLERLPISLPELVETSPSLTDDGSIITGERRTRVFALDRHTGALLHVFSDGEAGGGESPLMDTMDPLLRQSGPIGGGMDDVSLRQMKDPDRILLVGRQDFIVRSKQVLTDVEAWNATYSRIINLRHTTREAASRMPGSETGEFGGGSGTDSGARDPGRGSASAGATLPLFTVGVDHTLKAYDPTSRRRRWAVRFKTPPVGVFATAHGDTNFLDPTVVYPLQDRDFHLPEATAIPAEERRRRGGPGVAGTRGREGASSSQQNNLVLVGELKGSLYAMPAERVVLDERVEVRQPRSWSAMALPGPESDAPVTDPLPLPLLPPSSSAAADSSGSSGSTQKAVVVHSGSSSSKDLVTYARNVDTGEGVVSGLYCGPPGLQLLATVGEGTGIRQPWLPDASKLEPQRLPPNGSKESPSAGAGGLLTVVFLAAAGVGAAAVLIVLHFRGSGAQAMAAAVAGASFGGHGKSPSAAAAIAVAAAATAIRTGAAQAGAKPDVASTSCRPTGKGNADQPQAGSRGTGSGRGRRKGRPGGGFGSSDSSSSSSSGGGAGDGSSNTNDASIPASQVHLSSIPEDREASISSAPTAPHLPSAEPRVQVKGDGSLVIGRLVVGPGILGYGSAGTVVYEGVLNGRPVAVKRLLRQFTELARKEIEVLILSDEHPNVVRCFALEEDREFVYLALEKCRSTLSGFLETPGGRNQFVDPDTRQPTARCLSTLIDVCRGLAALHERGIVHRDLKPHNVLLTESGNRAKLSDMGLCKQLVPEQSSFESHHGPGGSSGWQAPEQLIARDGGAARQSRSMDVFSLGCILYYCMTGGRHPFGDNHYERDARILRGEPVLPPLVSAGTEAFNLVTACLALEPGQRPSVGAILGHPLWWSDDRRLAFLVDISDRVENEDREPDTRLLAAMESYAGAALAGSGVELADGPVASSSSSCISTGAGGLSSAPFSSSVAPNWGASLPAELVANLGRYRRYDYTSLRDLLRVVRNKRNHFREMPSTLQAMLGPLPSGFLRFFVGHFPCLLLAAYVFALQHLSDEPSLQQYWADGSGVEGGEPFVRTFMATYGSRMRPTKVNQQPQQVGAASIEVTEEGPGSLSAYSAPSTAPKSTVAAAAGGPGATAAATSAGGVELWQSGGGVVDGCNDEAHSAATSATAASIVPPLLTSPLASPSPPRPTAARPADSATTAIPGFAMPPPPVPSAQPPPLVLVGYEPTGDDGEVMVREFPRRPGKQTCDFYLKTGHCKFGESCVFDHPLEYAVPLTLLGLPLRPEEQICGFYLKNNDCRFGPACKFHHPLLRPVYAGSAVVEGGGNGGSGSGNESGGGAGDQGGYC